MDHNPGRDLWARMAGIAKCCTGKLESFYTGTDAITSALRWRFTITRRDGSGYPIVGEGETAIEAMAEGLDRAEHIGWNRP
jgi:hypothetical protein